MHDGVLLANATEIPHVLAPPKWLLVTHQHPDPDALACLWFVARFLVGPNAEYEIRYVPAGERLTEDEEGGYSQVIYADTGGGDADQHGRQLVRSSSFKLLVEKFQPEVDPALLPIIELTVATDNIDKMSATSIHQVFLGLAHYYWEKGSGTNWSRVTEYAFIAFDILYDREKARLKSDADFADFGRLITLPNGIVVGDVGFRPRLRDAAFERGADVVLWMAGVGEKKHHPGIQVHRKHVGNKLTLWAILEELRRAEARARGGVKVRDLDLDLRQMHPIGESVLWPLRHFVETSLRAG